MAYTITITRQGLVFDIVDTATPAASSMQSSETLHTDELANRIDEKALIRRPLLGMKIAPDAAPSGPSHDSHGSFALENLSMSPPDRSVDWQQRLLESSLLVAFLVLFATYFI